MYFLFKKRKKKEKTKDKIQYKSNQTRLTTRWTTGLCIATVYADTQRYNNANKRETQDARNAKKNKTSTLEALTRSQ